MLEPPKVTARVAVVVAGVPAPSVARTVTVPLPALSPDVGTWAVHRCPDLVAVTKLPLPSLASTVSTPAGESTYAVTGTVPPRGTVAPTSGARTKTEGPAAEVGARATPRNSVFAAAV